MSDYPTREEVQTLVDASDTSCPCTDCERTSFLYPGAYRHFPQLDLTQRLYENDVSGLLSLDTLVTPAIGRAAGWTDEPTYAVLRTDEVQQRLTEREEG